MKITLSRILILGGISSLLILLAIAALERNAIFQDPPIPQISIDSSDFISTSSDDLDQQADQVFRSAESKMKKQFIHGRRFKKAAMLLEWISLFISSINLILAGYHGRDIKQENIELLTIEDVLGREKSSKKNIRIVGVLLALVVVSGLFSQQSESQGSQLLLSANELQKKINQNLKDYTRAEQIDDKQLIIIDLNTQLDN
ncbi:hypothetical protein [Moorena sp. SIO3I6]|uniref:hypothetical protein n=1 Tax=Moorena sp. SIO3I6 TaxID=2607831 RepID=UPI0013F7F2E3|nr:hypothetical protein [Moorena sp. SIO3I6]NEP24885.1 hypothetical protein [Moorena sp. SIO3I6]